MADTTTIEWTDATWNVATGCDDVSPGCNSCYARTFAERWRGIPGHPFEMGFDVTLRPERLSLPLKWRNQKRVFVNSMSDLFHKDIPDEFIAAVWTTMFWTSPEGRPGRWVGAGRHRGQPFSMPTHTYQILTKRPGRMRSWVCRWGDRDQRVAWIDAAAERGWCNHEDRREAPWMPTVLPNAWLGVSVEDQTRADLRIPTLLDTPAAIHFLSCEPLLGPVGLKLAVRTMGSERGHGLTASYVHAGGCCDRLHGIDWVISGGESGRNARPAATDWFRSLRDQCTAANVAYFHKQHGEYRGFLTADDPHRDPDLYVNKTTGEAAPAADVPDTGAWHGVWRLGKKKAGRELDGREHNAFPEPR
ncbi:DUF5131 family protein [Streptomyces sp. NPDC001205]